MQTFQPSKIRSSYLQRIAEMYSFCCAISHMASWLSIRASLFLAVETFKSYTEYLSVYMYMHFSVKVELDSIVLPEKEMSYLRTNFCHAINMTSSGLRKILTLKNINMLGVLVLICPVILYWHSCGGRWYGHSNYHIWHDICPHDYSVTKHPKTYPHDKIYQHYKQWP